MLKWKQDEVLPSNNEGMAGRTSSNKEKEDIKAEEDTEVEEEELTQDQELLSAIKKAHDLLREVCDHPLDILYHVDRYLPFFGEIHYHAEIVVDFSSVLRDRHAEGCIQPLSEFRHLQWIHVGHFQVIHMPTHSHLFAIYCLLMVERY